MNTAFLKGRRRRHSGELEGVGVFLPAMPGSRHNFRRTSPSFLLLGQDRNLEGGRVNRVLDGPPTTLSRLMTFCFSALSLAGCGAEFADNETVVSQAVGNTYGFDQLRVQPVSCLR